MLPDEAPPENQHPFESAGEALRAAVAAVFPVARWGEQAAIVGVSGGADSVALVRLLVELRSSSSRPPAALVLAHYNYGLRGAASDADEEFVRELAASQQLGFRARKCRPQEKPPGVGWEAAWRDLRYQFFTELAYEFGARYLLLAHTADDQVETVLLRLLRGSSLAGLRGIPEQRPLTPFTTVVRPLLHVGRLTLRRYLEELGQGFQVDASNESDDFLRNRVRNQLLPLLAADYSPAIGARLLRLADEAGETQALLESLAQPLLERIEFPDAERMVIPPGVVEGYAAIVVRSALVLAWRRQGWAERDLAARHWHALATLVGAAAGDATPIAPVQSLNLPGNRVARRRENGSVWIEQLKER